MNQLNTIDKSNDQISNFLDQKLNELNDGYIIHETKPTIRPMSAQHFEDTRMTRFVNVDHRINILAPSVN